MNNENTAQFTFLGALNDFLPTKRKNIAFPLTFRGTPGIKDIIESIGIPHTEIDSIIVNPISVSFSYQLKNGDNVTAAPIGYSENNNHLQPVYPQPVSFILDVHLGKLARLLRLFGFDSLYNNSFSDHQIVGLAQENNRIILTRDKDILKYNLVKYGYWVRSTNPKIQIKEIIQRFNLKRQFNPFSICIECNSAIIPVSKESILSRINFRTVLYFNEFKQCTNCKRIYWKGSHYEKLQQLLQSVL